MSDLIKHSLLRSALIIISIAGALYVFGVVHTVREGTASIWQIVLAILVVAALVLLNRWWFRRSGTRI